MSAIVALCVLCLVMRPGFAETEVTIPVAVVMVEDVQMIDGQIVEILRTSTAMPVTMDLEFTTNYTQSDTDSRTITSKDAVSTEITNAALASATEMSTLEPLIMDTTSMFESGSPIDDDLSLPSATTLKTSALMIAQTEPSVKLMLNDTMGVTAATPIELTTIQTTTYDDMSSAVSADVAIETMASLTDFVSSTEAQAEAMIDVNPSSDSSTLNSQTVLPTHEYKSIPTWAPIAIDTIASSTEQIASVVVQTDKITVANLSVLEMLSSDSSTLSMPTVVTIRDDESTPTPAAVMMETMSSFTEQTPSTELQTEEIIIANVNTHAIELASSDASTFTASTIFSTHADVSTVTPAVATMQTMSEFIEQISSTVAPIQTIIETNSTVIELTPINSQLTIPMTTPSTVPSSEPTSVSIISMSSYVPPPAFPPYFYAYSNAVDGPVSEPKFNRTSAEPVALSLADNAVTQTTDSMPQTSRRTRKTKPTKPALDDVSNEKTTEVSTTRKTRKPKPSKITRKTTAIVTSTSHEVNDSPVALDSEVPQKITEDTAVEVTSPQTTRRTRRTRPTKPTKPTKPITEADIPVELSTETQTTRRTKATKPTTVRPSRPSRRTKSTTESLDASSTDAETTTRRQRRTKPTRKIQRPRPSKIKPDDATAASDGSPPKRRLTRPQRFRQRPATFRPAAKSEARAIAINSSFNYLESRPECTENEIYMECGPNCPETCEQDGISIRQCRDGCKSGCFCKDGYILNEGVCIKKEECQAVTCKRGEVFQSCGPGCEDRTCKSLRDNASIFECTQPCKRGCFCRNGFLRNVNGFCVPPSRCTKTSLFQGGQRIK